MDNNVINNLKISEADYYRMLTSRTDSITKGLLKDKRIAFVGTGASINFITSCARTGVKEFSLFDMDIVELPNIGRTGYNLEDLNKPKVEAAKNHIYSVNPWCKINLYNGDFLKLTDDELREALSMCDLIVMGTDAQEVQLKGNQIGYSLSIPMIFPGFYKKAEGGEIVVVTKDTPCYKCQVKTRFDESETHSLSESDLKSESGLVFDCDHLDSIAGKIAISLLLKDKVSEFTEIYEYLKTNSLIFSKHSPNFKIEGEDLFREFFGNSPLTCMYQTLWLDPNSWRNNKCNICSNN